MKKLFYLLILLGCVSAHAQLIYCNKSSAIPCNTSAQIGNGTQGDPAWLAFGKVNANFLAADIEAGSFAYCGSVANTSVDVGPCLQAAINAGVTLNRCVHLPGSYTLGSRVNVQGCLKGDGWSITQPGVGTWIHVVSANFMSGGSQFGNQPIQIGSAGAVNNVWIDGIAFTEDQPVDTGGWTPNNYGPLILVSSGSIAPKFTNIYAAGVNYFLNLHSIQGAWVENFYGQIYTTGIQIDHTGDWVHFAHLHFNGFFCSLANCPNIFAYTQANTIGIQSNNDANPGFVDIKGFGLNTLIQGGTDGAGSTVDAIVQGIDCDKCIYTINNTAAGSSWQIDGIQGHTFNFPGSAYLRGGTLISDSGGTSVFQVTNLRCQNTGDSCISLTSTGDTVMVSNSYLFQWGGNSTANGTCDATVPAINAGAANANTVVGGANTFSGSCSSLQYVSSNTVGFNNAQFTSWTPQVNFGGGNTGLTTSAAGGQYQINAHTFDVQFLVALTAVGSSTGAVTITGLPITTSNCGTWCKSAAGVCTQNSNMAGVTGTIVAQMATNSQTIALFSQAATGLAALTNSNFTGTTILGCRISGFQ